MTAADRLRRLRRLATRRGWEPIERKAKGSHLMLWLNGRSTVIARHAGDMPPGTFRKVMRDLDLTARDLEV
jgi:predicted RNA binding protein YcfA (HicA-like mRNA interferase family)